MQFIGERICVCGNFPTPEALQGITMDGKPLGTPEQGNRNVAVIRLPVDLSPGTHTIGGQYSAFFPRSDQVRVLALKYRASIAKQVLRPGESTKMTVVIEGTVQPIQLALVNLTPAVANLEGGQGQTAMTSGGTPNQVQRIITGIQPHQFQIQIFLPAATCPCARTGTDPSDVPEEGTEEGSGAPASDAPPAPVSEPPETPCDVMEIKGAFEPTQGAWQDDPYFKKYDKPEAGDKLKRLSDSSYHADLPMVQGRPTLLFGTGESDFGTIALEGKTNGTVPCKGEVVFSLYEDGSRVGEITRTPVKEPVYLCGKCGPARAFQVSIDTQKGLPPDKTFTFSKAGAYRIEAELVAIGSQPGSGPKVEISGDVKQTTFPVIHVVPVLRSGTIIEPKLSKTTGSELEKLAQKLAQESETLLDDFMPVAPGAIRAVAHRLIDLSNNPEINRKANNLYDERDIHYFMEKEVFKQALQDDHQQSSGMLSGVGRVVAVLREPEMTMDPKDRPNGLATSEKFILLSEFSPTDTIAHEIVHTMPFWWRENEMKEDCGEDFHNRSKKVAFGFRIINGDKEVRQKISSETSLMGNPPPRWINQCTYFHMINQLQNVQDPPVILVRGILGKNSDRYAGLLLPSYTFDGFVDHASPAETGWNIVLQDEVGKELSRFRFDPKWKHPDLAKERKALSFAYRIPVVENWHRIVLEGPHGILDQLQLSDYPPEIYIESPQQGEEIRSTDGTVSLNWTANDLDGDSLLFTVLYSSDGGNVWRNESFEQQEKFISLRIDSRAEKHQVRILATDGCRSSEQSVSFRSQ